MEQRPTDPPEQVAHDIEDLPPSEGAAIIDRLSAESAANISEILDPVTAAKVLSEMDPAQAARIISGMEAPEASVVLDAMHPDDRVDVLGHIPRELHDRLLGEMTPADAQDVRRLEQYPRDTAGGIMTTDVTALPEGFTVEQAIADLRRLSQQQEQMFYVYVVDGDRRLVGVLSMRDLILARPDQRLAEILRPNVLAIPATMDQEEVARLISKYNYIALPVVDDQRRLLGIVTVDDAVDVLQEEATEDVQKMAGASPEERLTSPWAFSFRKRLVWLIVNLATAFLAGLVVALFSGTIAMYVALAIYMPIVAGMGGNASAQAMSVSIRGLATGRVDRPLLMHVMRREALVGLLTGIVIGILTAAVALYFQGNPRLGLVVALALIINHTLACLSGATIPFVMKALGFDPAQSATIFATTVTDVAGFLSLLGLAKAML